MDNAAETTIFTQMIGAQYKLLPDPYGKVVKQYGVYNLLGDGVATPAVFIITADKYINWSYVGENIGDRPRADDILARLR